MTKTSFFSAICVVFAIHQAYGAIGGVSSLTGLASNADLIVSGSANGVVESGNAALITLTVARVVKGDPTLAGRTIVVNWEVAPGSFGPGLNHVSTSLPPNASGLWFLRRSSASWSVMPVWTGGGGIAWTFIPQPASPLPAAYSYASDAAVTDKVAAEVSFAIENAAADDPTLQMLQGPPLNALNSPYVQVLYQRLSASTLTEQHIAGLAGKIQGGSATALAAAVNSAASFAKYPRQNGFLLLSISNDFRATDAASVATLGQAAVSSGLNQPFREAAAHALARIHTSAALPWLATLLDDPDDALRIEAIGGFSAFANGLPVQTPANAASLAYLQLPASARYKTADTVANFAMGTQAVSRNEAKYLAFWKQWWSTNSASLGQ
jgi:hypothetical protein